MSAPESEWQYGDGDAWSAPRYQSRARDIPCQRPWIDTPVDPDALAAWTSANQHARDAYTADTAVADGMCASCLTCRRDGTNRRCAPCRRANRPELGARP